MDKILAYVLQPDAQFSLRAGLLAFMEDKDAISMVDTYLIQWIHHVERNGSAPLTKRILKEPLSSTFLVKCAPLPLLPFMSSWPVKSCKALILPLNMPSASTSDLDANLISLNLPCAFVHFLNGLKPDLRTLCCMDQDNRRWNCPTSLVKFSIAEEERLNIRESAVPAPHLSNHCDAPFREFGNKRLWIDKSDSYQDDSDDSDPASESDCPASVHGDEPHAKDRHARTWKHARS